MTTPLPDLTEPPRSSAPPDPEVPRLTEHLFRHESGKIVSVLTGMFGIDRLQMAEDVVQDALIRALQTWPYYGVPANPAAWLMQTAKNRALDILRREQRFRDREPQLTADAEERSSPSGDDQPMFDDEIRDGRLRLMFACCHPLIPREAQAALALRTLCGFSPAEIARAFLSTEVAITKRLTRARQAIRDQQIPFEIPSGPELSGRLDGVLQILYLLFSEGYKASSGDRLVREDICYEAIRLTILLTGHPATGLPRTHALAALMMLDAARLPARVDRDGRILLLKEQDRSLWDPALIARGIHHLARAARGSELSEYHLQAGIAASHCLAPDYASTDWRTILSHYDHWLKISGSPVVALNRAVAVAHVHGPAAGIEAVNAIPDLDRLDSYYLVYAVLGDFEAQLRNFAAAAAHFRKALRYAEMKSERDFLERRFRDCAENE